MAAGTKEQWNGAERCGRSHCTECAAALADLPSASSAAHASRLSALRCLPLLPSVRLRNIVGRRADVKSDIRRRSPKVKADTCAEAYVCACFLGPYCYDFQWSEPVCAHLQASSHLPELSQASLV